MDAILVGLMAFLVAGALIALELRDLVSAVVATGVVGLGLAILFLLLGAPDIAITQVVVEAIVVTVLIRAAGGERETRRPPSDRGVRALAALLPAGVVVGFLMAATTGLPPFGHPPLTVSGFYLSEGPAMTGATNVVTAVLLDFRAYDTLGEATVILAAIVGTGAILRRPARRDTPGDAGPEAHAPARVPETGEVGHA